MKKQEKYIAKMVVKGISQFAKANVACATGYVAYQPEVPKAMLKKEK